MQPQIQSDSDPHPEPPSDFENELAETLMKVEHPHELIEYIHQLAYYNSVHLVDTMKRMEHKLLLQGLEENDLHIIHAFLNIAFDGDIMKMKDLELTEKRAKLLERHFDFSA